MMSREEQTKLLFEFYQTLYPGIQQYIGKESYRMEWGRSPNATQWYVDFPQNRIMKYIGSYTTRFTNEELKWLDLHDFTLHAIHTNQIVEDWIYDE